MDKWGVWKQKKLKFIKNIVVKLYKISVKDIVTQNTMNGDNYTYTLYTCTKQYIKILLSVKLCTIYTF